MNNIIAVVAGAASAQPYYIRGDFNNWGGDWEAVMSEASPGQWVGSISEVPAGHYEFKIALQDWSDSWPAFNSKIAIGSSGAATFYYYPGSFTDGWLPDANRVGYDDREHGWEVIGSFEDPQWSGTAMVPLGGGVYQAQVLIPSAGAYEYKFRMAGSWDINYGNGGWQHDAGNLSFSTSQPNELWTFTLDLPGGRFQAIPEPAALSLLGFAGLALVRRRRQ